MAKEETGLSYAEIGAAMMRQANAVPQTLTFGLPRGEARTTAEKMPEHVASFDGQLAQQTAAAIVGERRRVAAAAKAKAEEQPPAEEEPKPTVKELWADAAAKGELAKATLERIARREGIDLNAPATSKPTGVARTVEKLVADRAKHIALQRELAGKAALPETELLDRARRALRKEARSR
jgi:hypothetical protein